MLKLKLQYFGPMMQTADSLKKTLMLGKTEGRRRRGRQDEMDGWHHQLNGHKFEQTPGDGEGQGSLACCSLRVGRVRHDQVTEQHKNEIACLHSGWTIRSKLRLGTLADFLWAALLSLPKIRQELLDLWFKPFHHFLKDVILFLSSHILSSLPSSWH